MMIHVYMYVRDMGIERNGMQKIARTHCNMHIAHDLCKCIRQQMAHHACMHNAVVRTFLPLVRSS